MLWLVYMNYFVQNLMNLFYKDKDEVNAKKKCKQ